MIKRNSFCDGFLTGIAAAGASSAFYLAGSPVMAVLALVTVIAFASFTMTIQADESHPRQPHD